MARDGKRKNVGFRDLADQVLSDLPPEAAPPGAAGELPAAVPEGGVAVLETPVKLSVSVEQLPELAQVAEGDEVMLMVAGTVTDLADGMATIDVGQVETAQPALAAPQIPEVTPGAEQFEALAGQVA